ncbi:MAG: protein kinase [bacterium]|nr:protein kinase [bacterium]
MIKTPPHRLCPDHQEMYRFVMGDLDEPSSQILSSHLEQCPQCNDIIAMEDEVLLAWLRRGLKTPLPADDPDILNAIQIAKQAGIRRSTASPESPPLPSMPAEIRDYQILEQIGAGGMGIVYRALHRRLKREVVLKVLNQRMSDDPSAVMRFEREMEAIGRLNHAHIVAAHDAGEVEGTHYLVMEYVDGITVSQLSRKLKQLSLTDACEIARQTAEALEFAHQQSLIHRDIKPSNLMISKAGIVKVLDLGLARLLKQELPDSELTNAGQIMGTVEYMAPEQAESLTDVDFRADIYSLGVTLYKLLAGASPYRFDEQNPAWKRLQKITTQTPIPLTEFRAELPPPLIQLVSDMLEREPAKRPASMAEVAERLQPFCAEANLAQLLSVDAAQYAEQHDSSRTILGSSLQGSQFSPDPDQNRETRPVPASVNGQGGNRRKPLLAALGGLGLVALLSVIIYLQSPSGAVEIRLADGVADDIQVNVLQEGRVIKVADQKSGWKIELKSGEYQLQLNDSDDEVQLDKHQVRILRGQSEVVSITRKPDTALARQDPHQQPPERNTDQPAATVEFQWPEQTKPAKLPGILTAPATFPEIPDWQIPLTDINKQARFSPDGKYYLLSDGTGLDPFLTLKQVATGEDLALHQSVRFQQWTNDSWYSWAPDSRAYCFATQAGLSIISLNPGEQNRAIPVEGTIVAVSWSPDGESIAISTLRNAKNHIQLWSPDGTLLKTLLNENANDAVYWELAWSPESQSLLAATNKKQSVLHLDPQTGDAESWFKQNSQAVRQISWSLDGTRVALAGDNQVVLTSAEGKFLSRHLIPRLYDCELFWSLDSSNVVVLSGDSWLIPPPGIPIQLTHKENDNRPALIAGLPGRKGERFLALDNLFRLQWIDLKTGKTLATVEKPTAELPVWNLKGSVPVQNMVWNQAGNQLAVFSEYTGHSNTSTVYLWNAEGTRANSVTVPGQAARLSFDTRGDRLTVSTEQGRLYQWSGQPDEPPREILTEVHNNLHYIRPDISFSHDGRYIACKSGIFDRKQNKISWTPPFEKGVRYGLMMAWSPVENILAVVSAVDGIVSLHKPDGSLIAKVVPEKPVNSRIKIACWSPNGQWLALPQTQPESVLFFSRDLKQRRELPLPEPDQTYGAYDSYWCWSSDSQNFFGLANARYQNSNKALLILNPQQQQSRIQKLNLPGYLSGLLACDPAGNRIILVQHQGTLCIHQLIKQNAPDLGPLLWQGQMYADGSSASFSPSGKLLSESQEGSHNLRCQVREADGGLTPWRYSDFLRRVSLRPDKAALMSVLSRGGKLHSNNSGEIIADTPNIQGLMKIESLSEPVRIDLTQGVTDLQGLEILKSVPEGTRLDLTGNRECTDKVLSQLQGATALVGLNLTGTAVTADCLPTLQSLSGLRELDLSQTGIRDETVAGLTSLKELQSLNLSDTLISDRVFDALLQIPQLKSLTLTGCQLSDSQIKRFQTERPDCELIR